MVSIGRDNIYHLRDYLLDKALEKSRANCLKMAFLDYLELMPDSESCLDASDNSIFQRVAIAGLRNMEDEFSSDDILRLLGQASKIDGTPMPWVSDIWGVLGVNFAAILLDDDDINRKYKAWLDTFLPEQVRKERLSDYERDIASLLIGDDTQSFSTACIELFLHYKKIISINNHNKKQSLTGQFFEELQKNSDWDLPGQILSIYVYVIDQINSEVLIVSPNGWNTNDLLNYLENIPVGLKRWTWEDKGKTQNSPPEKWGVWNEYHVQNILYVILAPIFNDITDENYLESLGQKTPRIDLYLPSIHTIIEVKYRKDTKKSFQSFIGEIAEDISLYRSDPKYKDCQLISFLWDHTRSTQEHSKFKEGVMKMDGIQGCVVICSPSFID
ncbi:MAG: hypothetical protein KZQ94_08575 [Candidatus Thiodiazotropha sp. (ex Troendleina suluensis)]|nr:hypothetical protein [Candidatus Thiodiazotropha sp. (ex Troendleina suluensis)]